MTVDLVQPNAVLGRERRYSGSLCDRDHLFLLDRLHPLLLDRPKSTPAVPRSDLYDILVDVKMNDEQDHKPDVAILKNAQRPTRPLPARAANPNPSMLPVQAHVPKGVAVAQARRLFVVLEQACLETYRMSSGSAKNGRKGGPEGEVKYTLLNCDDHQGILAKTGRDIADARPDITHQVSTIMSCRRTISFIPHSAS